jgi:signal transduction histidine kinase
VRPIERLAANMTAFSAAPEDNARIIVPSGRSDEIGVAEERLAAMQQALSETLHQRRHLADLGLAVSKINHDLRNILASAQLFSDRLGSVDDPLVRRIAPKLIAAIDRAIGYTRSVLAYGQAREEPPQRRLVSLRRLMDDVVNVLALTGHERIAWENRLDAGLEVDADPDQLFRAVMNVCRNAMEALESHDDPAVVRRLWAEGEREGTVVRLRICDTGPGIPAKAKARLFRLPGLRTAVVNLDDAFGRRLAERLSRESPGVALIGTRLSAEEGTVPELTGRVRAPAAQWQRNASRGRKST